MSTKLIIFAAVAVATSACSSTPQQIYHQASIGSEQAIIVIGSAQEFMLPNGRFTLMLDQYSPATEKTTTSCFIYNSSYGPPESIGVKYFAYRVPAGIYTASLDAFPRPNAQAFVAPGGGAVYFGDFVRAGNDRIELKGDDLPTAQNAVAPLLPNNLPLVKAASEQTMIRWASRRCSP